jgi:hypothetical protein
MQYPEAKRWAEDIGTARVTKFRSTVRTVVYALSGIFATLLVTWGVGEQVYDWAHGISANGIVSASTSAPTEPMLSTEKETIVAKEGGSQWYLMPPPAPAGSPYRVIVCWWPGPSPATYTVRINHDPGRVWTPGDYAGASITSFQYVAARGQIALTAQVRRVRQDADPAHVCDW